MDPLSQGVLGVAAAQAVSKKPQARRAAFMGLVAGLAPDADVFITSATDPLLSLQFHRQFTHALVFIPIGALLAALVLHPLMGRRFLCFRTTYLFCLAGYATHGLLDACTSYGTQLLWPFSDLRVAWNNISIIDPAVHRADSSAGDARHLAPVSRAGSLRARLGRGISDHRRRTARPRCCHRPWHSHQRGDTLLNGFRPSRRLPTSWCGKSSTNRKACSTSMPCGWASAAAITPATPSPS